MTYSEEQILAKAKDAFQEEGIQFQFNARNLEQAISMYKNSCMRCTMTHNCIGHSCSIEKAFIHNTKKFKNELENPLIRKKVELALDLG